MSSFIRILHTFWCNGNKSSISRCDINLLFHVRGIVKISKGYRDLQFIA